MRRHKYLYVYILKCADATYYTGVTNNLEKRFKQHNLGLDKESYTYSRRPLEIVYHEKFTNFRLAIEWETRIKKWSRKKKEALIDGNWEELKKAATCANETTHKRLR